MTGSQIRIVPSSPPEASRGPAAPSHAASDSTRPSWPVSGAPIADRVSGSQRRMVPSIPAEISIGVPAGVVQAISAGTQSRCPARVASAVPACGSHSRTVPSSPGRVVDELPDRRVPGGGLAGVGAWTMPLSPPRARRVPSGSCQLVSAHMPAT
ncbi:hypothetical protein ACFQY4_25725 [Catellatospora bangladeshensis]|uniref:hypothetical protein n=1 Tax=Catellatospora bangladeshensis TaxID=310355 RepID=UPI0036237DFB